MSLANLTYTKGLIPIIASILVIAKTCTIIPLLNPPAYLWFILLIGSLLYGIVKCNYIIFSPPITIFCIWSVLGIFIINPESYFKSYERLVAFVLNLAVISPLISNSFFEDLRLKLFSYSIISINIIVICSFIAYFLGINMATKTVEGDVYWGFGGITNHSMTLAPCAAIAFIYDAWKCLYSPKEPSRKYWIKWGILSILSLWILFVSGSRGTLIGCLISTILLLFFTHNKIKIYKNLLLIIFVGTIILPTSVYDSAFYSINRKMDSATRNNSLTSSRDEKWNARIEEFKQEPIFGVGFASQTKFTNDDNYDWIIQTGNLEPGSSWLAILAMTGVIGLILMALINYKIFKGLLITQSGFNILLISLLLFFIIHGCIEGWIIYAGGYIFFMYWLLIGVSQREINHDLN